MRHLPAALLAALALLLAASVLVLTAGHTERFAAAADCGTTGATGATGPTGATGATGPTGVSYSNFHTPDNLPGASVRFFSDQSPFNKQLPANPKLATNSSTMVARLLEGGSPKAFTTYAGTTDDYAHATYYALDSDPAWTISGGSTTSPYNVAGLTIHAPSFITPAKGSDHHLIIVWRDQQYGFWDASVNTSSHVITVGAGRKVSLSGLGTHAAETASRIASLTTRVRYPEFASGQINHALFSASAQDASSFVYPAEKSDGHNSAAAGYPPMGTRFQLDPNYMTPTKIATYPAWFRGYLYALVHYGVYIGDTTGSGWSLASVESGQSYLSSGKPDPFRTYGAAHLGQRVSDAGGGEYRYDLASGIDWTHLRAIDPCVAAGTC